MDTTETHKVKFYKGTVRNIAERYGFTGIKLYKFSLQLKSLFSYSYIYQYDRHIRFIAKKLNLDVRTIKNRIKKLIAHQFAYTEGGTLRLASDTQIRKHFGVQNYSKQYKTRYRFKWIRLDEINLRVDSQPLSENKHRQTQAIAMKNRNDSMKKIVKCQSSGQNSVQEKAEAIVGTTLMSQKKAAELYGYKSKTSGYRLLRRLSMQNVLEIESNRVELTKEEYNAYKRANCTKLLILGRGLDARFYYLLANTIHLKKKPPVKEVGVPYYMNENW